MNKATSLSEYLGKVAARSTSNLDSLILDLEAQLLPTMTPEQKRLYLEIDSLSCLANSEVQHTTWHLASRRAGKGRRSRNHGRARR